MSRYGLLTSALLGAAFNASIRSAGNSAPQTCAELRVTMAPGTWRGSDCVPKPCAERKRGLSWPQACRSTPTDAGAP